MLLVIDFFLPVCVETTPVETLQVEKSNGWYLHLKVFKFVFSWPSF